MEQDNQNLTTNYPVLPKKFSAQIFEGEILKRSLDFDSIDERQKWLESIKAIKVAKYLYFNDTYDIPFNPLIKIRLFESEIINLSPESSIESWLKIKKLEGRFQGNKENNNIYSSVSGYIGSTGFLTGSLSGTLAYQHIFNTT